MNQIVFLVDRVDVNNVMTHIKLSDAFDLSVYLLVHFWVVNLIRFNGEHGLFSFSHLCLHFVQVNDSLASFTQHLHMVKDAFNPRGSVNTNLLD